MTFESVIINPVTWGAVIGIGVLLVLGRTFLGRFQYTDTTPEDEAAQRKLREIHDEEEVVDTALPAIRYPKTQGRKAHHASLDKIKSVRKRLKTNLVEAVVLQHDFSLDIDVDRQKLALIDTRYPTMVKNRWELPLSFGNSSIAECEAKVKQVRAYAERQAVKEGLEARGKSRQRRVLPA